MYRVYINDRLLQIMPSGDSLKGGELVLKLFGDETPDHIKVIVSSFEKNDKVDCMYLQSANIDNTWRTFLSLFTILDAAGGVVLNSKKQLLMIYRNGKWDLPKGKIEPGEDPETTAVREVNEECSIGKLNLIKQLSTTFHTYSFNNTAMLKRTFWFMMETSDENIPVPQKEEGIEAVQWMDRLQILQAMENTFASIAFLMKDQVLESEPRMLG